MVGGVECRGDTVLYLKSEHEQVHRLHFKLKTRQAHELYMKRSKFFVK